MMKIDKDIFPVRLKRLMDENNETTYSIGKVTNLSPATISRYLNSGMAPKIPTVEAIARFFHVNPVWLMGLGDERRSPESLKNSAEALRGFTTSEAERSIIKKYRALDEHGAKVVSFLLNEEYARCTDLLPAPEEYADRLIRLPQPLQTASAGNGNWIDDDTAEIITVAYNPLTAKADYIMAVSGDSMEPRFSDGDRVLVREQPSVDHGEIGIYLADGNRYMKEYRGSYLHSLNPEYDDIPCDESTRCCGKVLGILNEEWVR